MFRKLTKAQLQCLASVAAGTVHMHFDVYTGFWWTEKDQSTRPKTSQSDAPRQITRLLKLQLIAMGADSRPYSGRRLTPLVITPAGRAILNQEQSNGD